MAKLPAGVSKPKSPLERSIVSRQRAIERMEARKQTVMEEAKNKCAKIDKSLAEKKVLLDALKRGAIKA